MPLVIPFNTFSSQKNIYPAVQDSLRLQMLRDKYARMLNSRVVAFKPRKFGF